MHFILRVIRDLARAYEGMGNIPTFSHRVHRASKESHRRTMVSGVLQPYLYQCPNKA